MLAITYKLDSNFIISIFCTLNAGFAWRNIHVCFVLLGYGRNGGYWPLIPTVENQNTHTHTKWDWASKVSIETLRITSYTRQTERMEKREKRMWRGDSVHLLVHETEASRILPTERNQLHPPTRSRGIQHIYISYFTVPPHTHISLSSIYRTKSRTCFLFFSFSSSSDAPFFYFPFTLPSPTDIGSLCQWHHRTTPSHFQPCVLSVARPSGKFSMKDRVMCTRWFRFGRKERREREKKWRYYSSVRFLHRLDSGRRRPPQIQSSDTMEV